MKRKTNLFYTSGPDSKFITFSNYTEALTGNFLSTDTKLFPDKFLCLKLHNINKNTKPIFIKYLVRYYENKLAVLRDNSIEIDELNENYELPLAYLLEAILNVCTIDENGFTFDINKVSDDTNIYKLYVNSNIYKLNNDYQNAGERLITYIGNITEQDYNGTYTDTICSINANEYYEGEIKFSSNNEYSSTKSCSSNTTKTLYGWEKETIFEEYQNAKPIFDKSIKNNNDNLYYYGTILDNIEFVKQPENNVYKNIEFNIIISLFSITNMNYKINTSILENEYNDTLNKMGNKCIILNDSVQRSENVKARKDVPLGMWIHGDETNDTFITLKRDSDLQMYPSWSLLIASQFKPFPYTLKYQKENDINKSALQAYPTFSEVLSKINDVLDKFNNINSNINKLDNRISSIERQIKEIGTQTNITQMEKKFLELHTDIKEQINNFKKQLYGYVDNITWSSKYNNEN